MIPARIAAARPRLERLRFPALAVVGALVAHDAIFAAQFGLGSARDLALASTAHAYWPAFVVVTLLAATVVAGSAIAGIVRLHRLVRGLPAAGPGPEDSSYVRELLRLWPRLLLVVVVAFAAQENIEHLAAGRPAPGLWALSAPGYPLAVPVLVAVTGLLAAVGAWLQWHNDALVGRLRTARSQAGRHRTAAHVPHGRWALVAALVAHRRHLVRRDSERAPPALAPA